MTRLYKALFICSLVFLYSLPGYTFKNEDMLAVVSQTAGVVNFYGSITGKSTGGVGVGFLPHEIITTKDYKTAFVSNFGLQDYDETIGVPGNSISVIDVPSRVEKFRLYTSADNGASLSDKAPHGLRLRPPKEQQLYVNLEQSHKLIVFDLSKKVIIKKININPHVHNFIFSPNGKEIFLMAGPDGIIRIDAETGKEKARLRLSSPVRGLIYTPDNRYIMASATNEIVLISPKDLSIKRVYKELGVDQILYSAMTPNQQYIIAPAVWNNEVIIIETSSGKIVKRIPTGLDPVTVKISSKGEFAYVTNARDNYVTQINLSNFKIKKIYTADGPNGLVVMPLVPSLAHPTLTVGVSLPLTGKNSAKGRDLMLGYEFWRMAVQRAGGIYSKGKAYHIDMVYLDNQSKSNQITSATEELITKYKIQLLLPTYGKNENAVENMLAQKYKIIFVPLHEATTLEWSRSEFNQSFERYYHLKANSLSARAYATGNTLQHLIAEPGRVDYKTLNKKFISAPIDRHEEDTGTVKNIKNDPLNKKREKVIKKYVALLGAGNYTEIPRLFSKNALAISSSGIEDNPTHFYKTLFTQTIKKPHAKLMNIFSTSGDVYTVYFYFYWTNQQDKKVASRFIDLIYFKDKSDVISKLMVFSNTFQNDIMKQLNQQ